MQIGERCAAWSGVVKKLPKTYLYISLPDDGGYFAIYNANMINPTTIDWGDGNSEVVSGSWGNPNHTYATAGDYVITISDDISMLSVGRDSSTSSYNDKVIAFESYAPHLVLLGGSSLSSMINVEHIVAKYVTNLSNRSISGNRSCTSYDLPLLVSFPTDGFQGSTAATDITLPSLVSCGGYFMQYAGNTIKTIHLPKCTYIGTGFFFSGSSATGLTDVYLDAMTTENILNQGTRLTQHLPTRVIIHGSDGYVYYDGSAWVASASNGGV